VIQQPARVGVFAGVLEHPVEARLVATPQCPPELRPALFDGPQCISVGWVRAPHRYRPPVPVAVHASSRGSAVAATVSPSAVTPVPTPSGWASTAPASSVQRRPVWRVPRAAAASTRTSSGSTRRRRRDRRASRSPRRRPVGPFGSARTPGGGRRPSRPVR